MKSDTARSEPVESDAPALDVDTLPAMRLMKLLQAPRNATIFSALSGGSSKTMAEIVQTIRPIYPLATPTYYGILLKKLKDLQLVERSKPRGYEYVYTSKVVSCNSSFEGNKLTARIRLNDVQFHDIYFTITYPRNSEQQASIQYYAGEKFLESIADKL